MIEQQITEMYTPLDKYSRCVRVSPFVGLETYKWKVRIIRW